MSNQRVTKLKKYDTLAEWIKRHGKTPYYYRDAVDGTYKIRAYEGQGQRYDQLFRLSDYDAVRGSDTSVVWLTPKKEAKS